MKITEVRATPVSVDFTEPELWSHGHRAGVTAVIVEVETDEGLAGVGESVPAPTPEVTCAAIASTKPLLIGEDPTNIANLMHSVALRGGWSAFPFVGNASLAGIEIALWDLLGKSLGKPVHALLGGALYKEIEIMGFVQNTTPAEISERAGALVAEGYRTLYTKAGFGIEPDVEATRALRDGGGPDVAIRIDPNEAYSTGDAMRLASRIAELDVQYIEQPISKWSITELATLRQRCPVPIAANQSSWLNSDILDIIASCAADVIMTDPWQSGGIRAFWQAAALCETAHVPLVYHSFAPLSIGMRAAAQVIATSSACQLAHQTYNHMVSEDVVVDPVCVGRGTMVIDDIPGIGATLDPDKVARASERFRQHGYLSPYGEPGWRASVATEPARVE